MSIRIQRGLVFAQSVNEPGRHDATGAFLLGGRAFSRHYGIPLVELNDTNDRRTMIDRIAEASNLDVIAYFGHGTSRSLSSAEIRAGQIGRLAEAINQSANFGCRIVLYACLTGVPGGFAEILARHTASCLSVVYAHTTAKHSYYNPDVVRFPALLDDDAPYLFKPRTDIFPAWQRSLHRDLWLRFPFMSKDEILSELTA